MICPFKLRSAAFAWAFVRSCVCRAVCTWSCWNSSGRLRTHAAAGRGAGHPTERKRASPPPAPSFTRRHVVQCTDRGSDKPVPGSQRRAGADSPWCAPPLCSAAAAAAAAAAAVAAAAAAPSVAVAPGALPCCSRATARAEPPQAASDHQHWPSAAAASRSRRSSSSERPGPTRSSLTCPPRRIAAQPQNEYIELHQKRNGFRLDHFERGCVQPPASLPPRRVLTLGRAPPRIAQPQEGGARGASASQIRAESQGAARQAVQQEALPGEGGHEEDVRACCRTPLLRESALL
jgi:hypothetical protein